MPCLFISYSSQDRKQAQAIHKGLEQAGFSVWRDESRLETDWSGEIARALAEQADGVCLIWTAAAARSKWVHHEWLTARALGKRIIPCLLPGSPALPEPLTTLHGVAFSSLNAGLRKLMKRLRGVTSFSAGYDYKVLPKHSFIPFNPNPDFVGRHADLVELYLKMIGNLRRIGLNQVGAVGMGGVGKTQLAVEFAYRYAFAFEEVFWLDGTDVGAWLRNFAALARDRLNLTVNDPQGPDASRQYLYALQRHLKSRPNTLIVLDNVDDPGMLNSEEPFADAGLTALSLGADFLFTSRRSFDIPGVVSQSVNVLQEQAAYDLLTAHRKPRSAAEAEHARGIVNAVGYLPLAVVLIAGYLKKYPRVSFAGYREELRKKKLGNIDLGVVSNAELATRHEAAVSATLQTQWETVVDKTSRLLFRIAGLFPESALLPRARLGLLAGIPPGDSPLRRPLDRAFLPLEELHLVEAGGAGGSHVRLHPLVREFAEGLVPSGRRKTFARSAAGSLASAYQDPARLESEWRTRGIDEVIEDVHAAIELGGGAGNLKLLERLLARERNHLVSTGVFAQQLHHRARVMGLSNLAAVFLAMQRRSGAALRTVSAAPTEDPGLVKELLGHENRVTGVAFLNDRAVLSVAWDSVILWDLTSGEGRRLPRDHSAVVNALAITPDGKIAVTGSDDKTVVVRNLDTGDLVRLQGHGDHVISVDVSADGRHALSVSRDGDVICWDTAAGAPILRFGTRSAIVALRADGRLLLSCRDNQAVLRDLRGVAVGALKAHGQEITSAAFAWQGSRALTAGHDGKLILWDTATCEALRKMDVPALVRALAFSRDDRYAITGCGKHLAWWDLQTGRRIRSFRTHSETVTCVAVSPDARLAASSAGFERTLTFWDLTSPQPARQQQGHASRVDAISQDVAGEICVSLDWNSTLIEWRASKGRYIGSRSLKSGSKNSLSWTGKRALTSVGSKLTLRDLENGAVIRTVSVPVEVHALALSPDGRLAFVSLIGDRGREILVVSSESGKKVRSPSFTGPVHFLSVTPDSRLLLIGSDYGLLVLWDMEHDRELTRLKGPEESLTAMCIEASGRYAVTGSWKNRLEVWDLETGRARHTLALAQQVTAVAMAGPRIIFGDRSGRMHFLQMV